MSLYYSFAGKAVLITGGAQGIGRQLVQQFYEDNAKVYTVDKNVPEIQKLREELPGVRAEAVDLTDWEETRKVLESFGPIDHLINNAAVMQLQDFMDITKESVNLHFGVNVGAVINVTQVVAKGLIELGREGSVVNICSIGGKFGSSTGGVAYGASKAALENLTKSMALELGAHNIRVNCVLPGVVDTPMCRHVLESGSKAASIVQKVIKERMVIKRPIAPSEIGSLVMFLLSPLSTMIVEEGVVIDGGRMASSCFNVIHEKKQIIDNILPLQMIRLKSQ